MQQTFIPGSDYLADLLKTAGITLSSADLQRLAFKTMAWEGSGDSVCGYDPAACRIIETAADEAEVLDCLTPVFLYTGQAWINLVDQIQCRHATPGDEPKGLAMAYQTAALLRAQLKWLALDAADSCDGEA